MKLTILAVSLMLYVLLDEPVRADPTAEAGRRLASSLPPQPAGQIKSMDNWLRWILARSRQDKEKLKAGGPALLKQLANKSPAGGSDEEVGSISEDFDDDVLQFLEGRQANKRQLDDYGHMRYGKREFDDYGHMRFGRR